MPWLEWHKRDEDIQQAGNAPYRLLQAVPAHDVGDAESPNMLIHGDNLDALKALLPYYAGQVKCIFIDPPYNTKSAFEHYDDNLEHSQWLAMMYPRLVLLRELLAEDGSIWVTIDDNEAHYLKVIMDEVFGRKNFVANVLWQKVYSERMDAQGFSVSHDHLFAYSRSQTFEVGRLFKDQNSTQFGYVDSATGKHYRRRSLRKEGSESRREDRPTMWYSINAPDGSEIWPVKPDGVEGRWRWKKENVLRDAEFLEYVKKDQRWEIYVKQFIDENATRPPATLWPSEEVGHNHEAKLEVQSFNSLNVFDTPKPERLIKRVFEIASAPGDLVLDSFLGSGTTSAVAHKMGRRWIGIEMGEHAITHCVPRLQKVIEGEQGGISESVGWHGGGGFRFYELGAAVFDAEGRINPEITFVDLAAHIWFAETGTAMPAKYKPSPLLGVHQGVAYYLLYNGILGDKKIHGGNVLTRLLLGQLPAFEGPRVIYGEASRIMPDTLRKLDITFKQTPYDIKAR